MENIMNFLVDNYIYVAAVSVFLIVVLIGIVIASSRKNKKKKEPDMVSISDVNTGSINDVAANLNMQNSLHTQKDVEPLRASEMPFVNNSNTMNNDIPVSAPVEQPVNNVGVVPPISEVPPVATLEDMPSNSYNNIINNVSDTQNYTVPTMDKNVEPEISPVPNFNQDMSFVKPTLNPIPELEPIAQPVNNDSLNQTVPFNSGSYIPQSSNAPQAAPTSASENVDMPEKIDIIDFAIPESTVSNNSIPMTNNDNISNFNNNNNQ